MGSNGQIQGSKGALSRYLRAHSFEDLFIEELGWDRFRDRRQVRFRELDFELSPVAQKRGLAVFQCSVDSLRLRDRSLLRGIQRGLVQFARENLVIYVDPEKSRQVWQWATLRSDSKTLFHREHPFRSHSPPEEFLEFLLGLQVGFDEEESISLSHVTQRAAQTFNRRADEPIFFRNPKYMYEAQRLAKDLKEGSPGAFERFLEFHDPLACWMARRYEHVGVDSEDTQQIARLGLIQAARRFQLERQTAFSTYAYHWLRQSCQRWLPSHAFMGKLRPDQFWRFHYLKLKAERRFARDGPWAERTWLEKRFAKDELVGAWAGRIERLWRVASYHEDRQSREEANSVNCPSFTPYQAVERIDLNDLIRTVLARLDPIDAKIVQRRFGIGCDEKTLVEIGEEIGLTRERVRQREQRGLVIIGKWLSKLFGLPKPEIVIEAEKRKLEQAELYRKRKKGRRSTR